MRSIPSDRFMRAFRIVPIHFWLIYASSLAMVFVFSSGILREGEDIARRQTDRCSAPQSKVNKDIEEITFISVPKPFIKKDSVKRLKLAMSSWLAASPKSKVLMFVNRTEFDPSGQLPDEIDRLFGKGRVTYAGYIRGDIKGIPYIDDWFRQGILRSTSRYVCFINADIVISAGWLRRAKQVFKAMGDKPTVLIGQRVDFKLENEQAYQALRFDQQHLLEDIDNLVKNSEHDNHSPYGIDTFTFRADNPPFDYDLIPPFIMGRYNWDNWLVGWLNNIAETVTFELDPPVYHIDHQRYNFDTSDDRVAINHHLKKANNNYFGSNYDARWRVSGNTLEMKAGMKTVIQLEEV